MVVSEHPFEEGTREAAQSNARIVVGLLTGAESRG